MKNKFMIVITCILLVISMLPISAFSVNSNDIVILYENDVHCIVEGYSKLAAMKKELQESYSHVGVVSGGDFIQGNSLGVVSKGEYIINLMNLVGYDAVTLGNHEFDYKLDRLNELVEMMNTKPVCCNFQKVGEDTACYEPYSIVSYGDVDIAYIGITTPSTISSSAPAQFKDENGNYIYTFHSTGLYDVVQESIDSAEAQGADYVIALSHIGYAEDEIYGDLEDVETLIKNTSGFDAVLDAHSHTVIESQTIEDKDGNDVLLSSAGTKFEYIGKLTISGEKLETELIKTEEYKSTDPVVDAYIDQIYDEYSMLGERKVAFSEVDLITKDKDGNRLVRNNETNLGDLCAEAFRNAVDADIGYINGGSLRADIPAGDVTFNNKYKTASLKIRKTVEGTEAKDKDFSFMVDVTKSDGSKLEGTYPTQTGDNPGSVTFQEGIATLLLRADEEVTITGLPANSKYSVDETSLPKGYSIKNLSNPDGMLTPADTIEVTAENRYTTTPGIAQLKALKRYVNAAGQDLPQKNGMFEFAVCEVVSETECNGIGEAQSNGRGEVVFPVISYTDAGNHTYRISEIIGSNTSIAYDRALVTAEVAVTDNGEGELVTTIVYKDKDGNRLPEGELPVFVNRDASASIIPVTGSLAVWSFVAVFGAVALWFASRYIRTLRTGKTGAHAKR